MRKQFWFWFYLLSGIIIGTLIASVCANVNGLSWLSYGNSIGLSPNSPMVIDLIIIKLAFGCSMTINVAQIICVFISMYIYRRGK